jgi:ABC-type polysaccharide/polyol phosphate export permease
MMPPISEGRHEGEPAIAVPPTPVNDTVGRKKAEPVYDSARRPRPPWEELTAAWRYRELLLLLVARDVKVRYKRSVLGFAWTMLNPLAMMIVLSQVFQHLFRVDLPNYAVYIFSATILWGLFAQGTVAASHQLLSSGSLVSRIYVPRTIFALTAVGSALTNAVLALVPLAGIMIFTGAPIRPALLWLPGSLFLATLFTLGIALLVSSLALTFADVAELFQIILSAWYFATPIIYPESIIPADQRWWLALNPMYYFIEAFRAPIFAGVPPSTLTWVAATVAAVGAVTIGWLVFTIRADEIGYRV